MYAVVKEIKRELANPTQQVSEIHDFKYPDETKLRKHLEIVEEYLRKAGF